MMTRCAPAISLRLDHLESSRLAWAFALSVAVHLLAWGTYETGKRFDVWERIHVPMWIKAITRSLPKAATQEPTPVNREAPLVFINVNPQHAVTEPPKNAKYYSSHSSKAANPDANRVTDTPKITGTQTQVPKTEDVPREKFEKLQPSPPAAQDQSEAKPKPTLSPGDLTMAKPDLNPRTDNGDAERPRPRTLKEAYARRQMNQRPGQKMKQDGGVKNIRLDPGFDVKATGFGAYDEAFIDAVSSRWYALLENIRYDGYQHGKVVLQFHLNYDGRITEMKVAESTVGEMLGLLCQKAVLDPAPFEKWPREMRLMVGSDSRPIQFTFFYN
ncbi:MAG: hypothetical protein MUF81_08670 [Verrucomicrobia bacterium]|jgi:outer membrane biosynthesis protein TonB|nr:hypothetical protein [Verrucomicrobiota bacterium]